MWVDGYWTGWLIDGYPETYFDNDRFEFPWEKGLSLEQSKEPRETKDKNDIDLTSNL